MPVADDFHRSAGWVRWEGPYRSQELADEVVLRDLLTVDRLDDEDVVAFVARHGVISTPVGDVLTFANIDITTPRPAHGAVHVDELRLYLAVMQAAVDHWIADQTNGNVVHAWQHRGLGVFVGDEADAWMRLVQVLNDGCSRYAVRAELVSTRIPNVTIGGPQLGLFSAMCLQLYNLLAEELPPKKCGNETCPRYFVRQQGRAEHGQHRVDGVTYCSRQCARAQAERERRRRKRKENER